MSISTGMARSLAAGRGGGSGVQAPQELGLVHDLDAERDRLVVLRAGSRRRPRSRSSSTRSTRRARRPPAPRSVASSRDSDASPPSARSSCPRAASGPSAAARSSAIRTPAARSRSINATFSGSSNHARTLAAISGPIPGTASIWSSVACRSASIEPNASASTCATCEPTWRMFSPTSSRQIGRSFDASICVEDVRDRLVLEPRDLRRASPRPGRRCRPGPRSAPSPAGASRSCSRGARCPSRRAPRNGRATRSPATGSRACSGSASRPRPRRARAACRTRGRSSGTARSGPRACAWTSTGPDDLGDHVARAADDHRVPCADILAADLVLVVQRRVRDRDAADRDRLQHGERRDLARPAGVHVDPLAARSCAPPAGT